MNKNNLFSALFSVIGLVVIVGIGITIYSYTTTQNLQSNNSTQTNNSSNSITSAELAKNNTKENCWVKYKNSVYNVTSYIKSHPGGAEKIIENCGGSLDQYDASHPGGSYETAKLQKILEPLKIGEITN
jgi:cytochrome b involved in lipid metabolism